MVASIYTSKQQDERKHMTVCILIKYPKYKNEILVSFGPSCKIDISLSVYQIMKIKSFYKMVSRGGKGWCMVQVHGEEGGGGKRTVGTHALSVPRAHNTYTDAEHAYTSPVMLTPSGVFSSPLSLSHLIFFHMWRVTYVASVFQHVDSWFGWLQADVHMWTQQARVHL